MTMPLRRFRKALSTIGGRLRAGQRWRQWRLHRHGQFRAGNAAIYRLIGGQRFVAHPGDKLSEYIAVSGRWEPLESLIAEKILRAGDVAIDVGAHVGYFTALFSRLVGPHGRVYSLEPGEATFSKLQTTIKLLGLQNVEAHDVAVADYSGRHSFIASTDGYDALQSLAGREWMLGGTKSIEVNVVTLDEFLSGEPVSGQRPSLIKCDVEGAELQVLAGCAKLLSGPSPPILVIEVGKDTIEGREDGATNLLELLRGYRIYFTPLESDNVVLQAYRFTEQLSDTNLVAFPTRGDFAGRITAVRELLSDRGL